MLLEKNIKIERLSLNFCYDNASAIGEYIFLLEDGTRIWPVSTLISVFTFLKLGRQSSNDDKQQQWERMN